MPAGRPVAPPLLFHGDRIQYLRSGCNCVFRDKDRLSKDEVECMVTEAEKFSQEDEAQKKKIEVKNGLENYAYSLRNTMKDDKLKDKFGDGDKQTLEDKVNDGDGVGVV